MKNNKEGNMKKDKEIFCAGFWQPNEAKEFYESLYHDLKDNEHLEKAGVKLTVNKDHTVIECIKCGEKWRVNVVLLGNVSPGIPAFLSDDGIHYRCSFECPNGCNEGLLWEDNIH
jgi:hypothetical protein